MVETLSPTQIVELAQRIESCGEAFYQAVLDQAPRPEVRALVQRLRDDEKAHGELFSSLVASGEERSAGADPERMAYLTTLVSYQVFPDPDAARAFVLAVDNETTLLRHAINFEKDTILLLHELRVLVGAERQPLVDRLIEEERGHVRKLDRLLSELGRRPATR